MINDTPQVQNNFFLQFLTQRRYRVYRHLLLLLFIALGPLQSDKLHGIGKLLIFLFMASMFYTNMYFLVPRYLLRNKFTLYVAGIGVYMLLLGCLATVIDYLQGRTPHLPFVEAEPMKLLFLAFGVLILVAASTAIKLFQRWVADSKRINELEVLTMHAELEQLKNQVNPHFLFNTLNNAHVLTRKDPAKASQLLLKLSDLLRYQLYDSARSKVFVTADIQFLTDFLNLEKIRRDNFEFSVIRKGELNGVQIAPLLYIIFIENAVKHNMDAENTSFVHVNFEAVGDTLRFYCVNSKPPGIVTSATAGGLGLVNIKRRLTLLYPERHTLTIKDEENSFSVTLIIKL